MDTTSPPESPWGSPSSSPWCYRILSGSDLETEINLLANPGSECHTDFVSFQPCRGVTSEDRYVISKWALPGGIWKFTGIFDGHGGADTVNYVLEELPRRIKTSLTLLLSTRATYSPDDISNVLVEAIADLDNSLLRELMDILGPDLEETEETLSEIESLVGGLAPDDLNTARLLRCMRGSTVLVSLVDSSGRNLWVASLGDCQAVLGRKDASGSWTANVLSSFHNAKDHAEVARMHEDHPLEDPVVNERVLGALSVTRAIGDYHFKLPAIYTDRIFLQVKEGFLCPNGLREVLNRNLTPPYVSNQAEVCHMELGESREGEQFLIMCSDGLLDLYKEDRVRETIAQEWVCLVGSHDLSDNRALGLLRDALGGDNEEEVSWKLTRELEHKWMDDTTVLVQAL